MSTPNEPKPLGAEEIEKLLARFEPGWKSFMKFVDHFFGNKGAKPWVSIPAREDNDDLFVTALLRDAESTIRTLTAENATLLKQRDMMSHLLNGGTFTPEEIVAAGLGMCTLEDRAHAVFRLKQENATLKARVEELEVHLAGREESRQMHIKEGDKLTAQLAAANAQNAELRAALESFRKFADEEAFQPGDNCVPGFVAGCYHGWGEARNRIGRLLKAALAQAGYPICVNCGVGFILPSGVCDHCDTKQAGGKVGA